MTWPATPVMASLLIALFANAAPPAPVSDEPKRSVVAAKDNPQTCAQARKAQAAAADPDADPVKYPQSYRSAEEFRAEIQKFVELLCDEPVGDYGSSTVWEEVDKPANKGKDQGNPYR